MTTTSSESRTTGAAHAMPDTGARAMPDTGARAMPDGSHSGHGAHMGHMGRMAHMGDLKRRFFISLALAVPVLLLSPMMGIRLSFQASFAGSDWIVLALSTALYGYGGGPFLRGAVDELKARRPAMMTLIALGVSAAYLYSVYAFFANRFTAGPPVMDFFWELATLIVVMLLGHWIEMRAVSNAGDALQSMARLLPATASVRRSDGTFRDVPLSELTAGRVVMVKPGDAIPADGVIEDGQSSVNESLVTGEAREVSRKPGDAVIGGSRNGSGSLLIKVTGTGESGYLAQVMRLVGQAQTEKSRAETLSDQVARALFYVAVGAGLAALVVWYALTSDFGTALTRMVTVLVIACPHALGLAAPLVIARSTTLGARNGLLVRNRQAMEAATKVDVVAMDKTGTLTEGAFRVLDVASFDESMTENDVLEIMGALETGSSHPLARGILREMTARGLKPASAPAITTLPGAGLSARLNDGREALLVSPAWLDREDKARQSARFAGLAKSARFAGLSKKGATVSFLVIDDRTVGMIGQGDDLKPGAEDLVRGLKAAGLCAVMLTGDGDSAARSVAERLDLDDCRAGLAPSDKERIIADFRAAGRRVMMVGDGVNDAPALTRADVGVAIGAGTDVAIDSADVVLVKSDPADILRFLELAGNTMRKMRQNLWWGAGYNIVAIPLAAGALAPMGVVLSPAMGAVLMSLSTVIVAANAMTLRLR